MTGRTRKNETFLAEGEILLQIQTFSIHLAPKKGNMQ